MSTAPASRLVTNASLIDGTGSEPRPAEVLIVGGRIREVSPPGTVDPQGYEVLDAAGRTVAPGFIDVHSHADNAPLLEEDDTSKILQGVTTEVVGNCGFTLAPVGEGGAGALQDYSRRIFPPMAWDWTSFADFLAVTDAAGYVTNVAPLVGHNAVRIAVLGMDDRHPSPEELAQMQRLVAEAADAGAFGLSSGLIYPPGLFSRTEELVALASRLPEGRPYVTHMRGEGNTLMASLHEAVRIGRESGHPLHVSHLKAAGRRNWGAMGRALEILREARAGGVAVTQDVYPYTAASTMLTAALPPWFQDGGDTAVLQRLSSPAALARLRAELERDSDDWENQVASAGWSGLVVSSTDSHEFEGLSLSEIAEARGEEPFEALVHVLVQEKLQASMVMHMMREDDLQTALGDAQTMIGSDGLPPGRGGKPHPRQYGTFPRVLARYSRQKGTLTPAEAVRRMTSLPAETFGLGDRGVVAAGRAADLVCFAPEGIADRATYADPVQGPDGIAWVVQNGHVVVRDGTYLGLRRGERLTPRS
jgi:N-acyl-D-amino-acid deacylase